MGQSGKITQLKTAAKNLLTTLKAAAKQPGDVKVSIIPFDTMVNVGTVYKDEFWIDYTVKNIQKDQWTGCVMDRDQSKDVSDTTPVSGSASTLFPAKQCNTSVVSLMPLTDCSMRPASTVSTARSTRCRHRATPTSRSGSPGAGIR